jgi:hypothetical protein
VDLAEGARWRWDRTYECAAWMVALLLQPYQAKGAPAIQPRDLLHPPQPITEDDLDALEMKQAALRAAGKLED